MKINMNSDTSREGGCRTSFWSALESGTDTIPSIWRERVGEQFDTVKAAFLDARPEPSTYFRCRKCGCAHEVTIYGPDDIVAVCTCDPWNCDDLMLRASDIEILKLNWTKLARALCCAFGLDAKTADFGLFNTGQIGSWSCDAVPVILTIQRERHDFQHVVAILAARLRRKFILLAPTSAHLDAISLELLANVGAEFFALETNVTLTHNGNLQPTKTPGEIFARFRPEPTDDLEMLRKAILLVKAADSGQGARKVTLYTVMRLYCFDGLSARQITRRCGCARSITFARLAELRQKLGREPAELRQYSAHFENIEDSLSDQRAKCIYRKGAAYGDEDSSESED